MKKLITSTLAIAAVSSVLLMTGTSEALPQYGSPRIAPPNGIPYGGGRVYVSFGDLRLAPRKGRMGRNPYRGSPLQLRKKKKGATKKRIEQKARGYETGTTRVPPGGKKYTGGILGYEDYGALVQD